MISNGLRNHKIRIATLTSRGLGEFNESVATEYLYSPTMYAKVADMGSTAFWNSRISLENDRQTKVITILHKAIDQKTMKIELDGVLWDILRIYEIKPHIELTIMRVS